ncbi:MAG: glycoside hydrolase family 43 protein [Clostridia bacterium]|nr:glycoside hydrolase family 43 protein [Clostridia bacterium]
MIQNPILPGFNPDPCICRRGNDFYLAVSSFEWMPGIPIYHSRDLKHWELYAHALNDDETVDLKKLPASKGIWAPCLTWSETDGLFYVVYGIMNSMNARYFDIDNYLMTAKDLRGPWSEPVYLHSAGFDASLLHDDDGRKYVVSLEWETRDGYEKPGAICVAEYDPVRQAVVGYPRRIWRGGTDRGCLEGPHITRHNGLYYLMCAEGGTGYYHCVTMARSSSIWGPYEGDPENPILTSQPIEHNERADIDHLKTRYYNPEIPLQKAGHGSYVDLPGGETYMTFHVSRPFLPELRCTMGRETAIQRMRWTEDGWLRSASGSKLPQVSMDDPDLPEHPLPAPPSMDDFEGNVLGNFYYAPRQVPWRFADVKCRPGWVRLRGQESQTSLHRASLLMRKLTSLRTRVTTKMDFHAEVPQHDAGLMLYYDNMNFLYLRRYFVSS